jgi:hypothetical protein
MEHNHHLQTVRFAGGDDAGHLVSSQGSHCVILAEVDVEGAKRRLYISLCLGGGGYGAYENGSNNHTNQN